MKKSNLPTKICKVCLKPFAWRKKWKKDWDNVAYCSERCRRSKKNTSLSNSLKKYGRSRDTFRKGEVGEWKKYFNLINSQKDASRTRAIEIFPYFSTQLSKKKDSNKADAILIASFYYETHQKED